MNLKKYNTITVIDADLVLPASNRERLIHLVADYSQTDPAELDIDQALALLGLRRVDCTMALNDAAGTTNTDADATTALTDLVLLPNDAPARPWITRIIGEHPDIFLTLHSSQIHDEVDLAGSVPFVVYQDNATSYQTIMLVRIDAVHNPGDTHLTVERTVITEMSDPETWYYPILAENRD